MLEASKAVFAEMGVDAPVREVAAKAGLGVATIYRRFPTRSDLVAAAFRREVDACTAKAAALATSNPPGAALALWLRRYEAFLSAKRGLAAALHSGDPALAAPPDYFRARFELALRAFLDGAAEAGAIRGDVAPYALLQAIARLSGTPAEVDGTAPGRDMVDLLIDGLRFGAVDGPGSADL